MPDTLKVCLCERTKRAVVLHFSTMTITEKKAAKSLFALWLGSLSGSTLGDRRIEGKNGWEEEWRARGRCAIPICDGESS